MLVDLRHSSFHEVLYPLLGSEEDDELHGHLPETVAVRTVLQSSGEDTRVRHWGTQPPKYAIKCLQIKLSYVKTPTLVL